MAGIRSQARVISPGALRRLTSVANALSAPAAVELADASGSTALIAVAAALGGAAIAYSYDRYGYPRAPSSAVPVPGSSNHVASGQLEVEDKHDTASHSAAQVGLPVEALDTPALLIDMDALEHNIRTYVSTMEGRGCIWRPHCKAVRSPELARMLVDAGAVGVTCAKISQASALADGGITDILIANEIVAPAKVAALIDLARKVDSLCVAVDDEVGLRAIADAAMAAGIENLDVLVDVNVGMNRCGIHWENRKEIVRLSQLAETIQGVGFRGLMGYDGGEVATAISSAERLHAARNAVQAAGTAVKIISGAGSENYWIASGLGEGDSVWEMQGGGGVLCCQKYYNTFNTAEDAPTHKYSLHLLAQVVSVAGQESEGRVIGDAGFKASLWPFAGAGGDDFLPLVRHREGLTVAATSAEHTIFKVSEETALNNPLQLGERVMMVPFYSDATMLLHRQAYAVRNGTVEVRIIDLRLTPDATLRAEPWFCDHATRQAAAAFPTVLHGKNGFTRTLVQAVWSLEGSIGRLQ